MIHARRAQASPHALGKNLQGMLSRLEQLERPGLRVA